MTRPDSSVGKMPLKGAPNGSLTSRELRVLVAWLNRIAIPLKSVTLCRYGRELRGHRRTRPIWDPPNASNQEYTLTTSDTNVVSVVEKKLIPLGMGSVTVFVTTNEGNRKLQAKLVVGAPQFTKNILPITTFKCAPCHEPGQTFNFQDSTLLILSGAHALDRLQRDPLAAGKMPLRGAPNGDLSPLQKAVILAWLNTKVIPLLGISVSDDSLLIGETKAPKITYNPTNANNKSYFLASLDTTKVTIDGDKYVGVAAGSTQVEVRALDGNHLKIIAVKVKPVPIESLAVSDTLASIGDTVVPQVEFFPENATNKAYLLSLAKASTIVSIAAGSKSVVGLSVGKDTVVVATLDGLIKSRFAVTVGPVLPKTISIRDTNNVIGVKVGPVVLWNPVNTTNKGFTLTIAPADTLIASVTNPDSIRGKAVGAVNVTAKSVADPTVTKVFKFTVGPVPVTGITMTATTQFATITTPPTGLNARSFLKWAPTNATDKRFTMVSAVPARVQVATDTTIFPLGLGTTAVTVKSLSDTSIKAVWNVTVVRPQFSGAIRTIFSNKCSECHNALDWPERNWLESTQVVTSRALISTRINAKDGSIMPRLDAANGPLTATELATLTKWLGVN